MSIKGSPVFDALAMLSLEAGFRPLSLKGTAAFVNSTTGGTHGWTSANGSIWSNETVELLKQLAQSMELDLAREHLGISVQAPRETPRMVIEDEGLAEHLGGEDPTPSV